MKETAIKILRRIFEYLKINEKESSAGAKFFIVSFILISGILFTLPFEYARWIAFAIFVTLFVWFVIKVR